MVSYCGANFFIALRRKIQTSIEWRAIQFACKFHGTKITRRSRNGQMRVTCCNILLNNYDFIFIYSIIFVDFFFFFCNFLLQNFFTGLKITNRRALFTIMITSWTNGWNLMLFFFFIRLFSSIGPNGLSLDRCHYDSVEAGGLDPPFGETRCRLFLDQRWPVDLMGGRHEGNQNGIYFQFRNIDRGKIWPSVSVVKGTIRASHCSNIFQHGNSLVEKTTISSFLIFIIFRSAVQVFDELLLDADWSVNAGMWMWLSCSSFFQQFFHCICPVRFGRKADPNGDYIRYFFSILKNKWLKKKMDEIFHNFTFSQTLFTDFEKLPNAIYPWAVEGTAECPASVEMYRGQRLFVANGESQ